MSTNKKALGALGLTAVLGGIVSGMAFAQSFEPAAKPAPMVTIVPAAATPIESTPAPVRVSPTSTTVVAPKPAPSTSTAAPAPVQPKPIRKAVVAPESTPTQTQPAADAPKAPAEWPPPIIPGKQPPAPAPASGTN